MGPSLHFDPDTVCLMPRFMFWSKGFHGTSFDDITAVSGLTKPRLHAAFGDKNALFRKALDRYHGFLPAVHQTQLAKGVTAREAIATWLADYIPRAHALRPGLFLHQHAD